MHSNMNVKHTHRFCNTRCLSLQQWLHGLASICALPILLLPFSTARLFLLPIQCPYPLWCQSTNRQEGGCVLEIGRWLCEKREWYLNFNVLLTVHHAVILGNWPTWRTNSFQCIYLFIVLYMFRADRAHPQEKQLYQYSFW